MPDDSSNALDLGAIIRERDTFRDELERAKARIKELNGESAGRRLNEERLGKIADERATALEVARADAEKALQATRDEWASKLTAAEQAAAERDAKARERVTRADLRVAAREAGMLDLDGLKLLDTAALKLGDDGTVLNAAEALAALRQSKPWAFGQATTSATAQAPAPATGKLKHVNDMTDAELAEFRRANGIA